MSNLPPPPPPPPPGRGRGQQRPSGDQRPTPPGGGGEGMRRPGSWPRWTMWVLLAVVALALVLPSLWPSGSGQKISYTQFMDQVRSGQVKSVTVNNSSNVITGHLQNGDTFTTTGGGERSLAAADEATIRDKNVDLEFKTP